MELEQVRKVIQSRNYTPEELDEVYWQANSRHYIMKPPTIDEIIDSHEFFANKWPNVYPLWRETLHEIYPSPFRAPYNEVIVSAAAGAGKTVTATIGTGYDMIKLACLKDPCSFYGLAPGTMLIFAVFSATGSTAAVNWQDLTSAIEMCPWMMERLVDKRGLEKKSGSLVPVEIMPGIFIQTGSKFHHSMGKAIFDGLMDEAAFGGENMKDAQKTYNELSSRMATRFRSYSKRGNLPGHLFLISSPKEASDFMQYRIDKAEKAQVKRTLIKKNISSWDANPANDSDNKFIVFVGNEIKEPKIYEKDETPKLEDIDYLIYPPMSYYENFQQDILGSIMNYGGVTTIADTSLFKSPSIINEAMVAENPFTNSIIELPFDKMDKQLMDYIDMNYFKDIRYPHANRFIHIDAAYSSNTLDVYGLSAGYCIVSENSLITQEDRINQQGGYSAKEKVFYIDWSIGIKACKGQEVPLSKVENFIIYLIKQLNYPVACISADTFQSKQTLQNLEQQGYSTMNISVDRTRDPYLFIKRLLFNRQLILPKNERLRKELFGLRDNGKKIDHTSTGTKDIADSVAGCIWSCANSNNIINLSKLTQEYTQDEELIIPQSEEEQKAWEEYQLERLRSSYSSTLFKNW